MAAEDGATVVVAFTRDLLSAYLVASNARAGRRVVAVTVDTSGGPACEEDLERRARALGADEHVVADAGDHVYERYVSWLIKGGVTLGGGYSPWPTAERYAEVDALVAQARRVHARAVVHGARGEDLVLVESSLRALAPEVALHDAPVAPLQARAWLEENDLLPVVGDAARLDLGAPRVRTSAWGSTATGGELDDPWSSPEAELFPTIPDAADASALPEEFEVEFTQGLPTACCGAALDGPSVVRQVTKIARRHGVGRGVHLGEGALGVVARTAYEAPAATVLLLAHGELERLVLTRRQLAQREALARTYGDLFQRGLFLEPLMRDLERFFDSTQRTVTGAVRVRIQRGAAAVVGVRSPAGLAGPEAWANAEGEAGVDARDARGFARVLSLPGRAARQRDERAALEGGASARDNTDWDDEPA
jgi:argininosuccinate synthase